MQKMTGKYKDAYGEMRFYNLKTFDHKIFIVEKSDPDYRLNCFILGLCLMCNDFDDIIRTLASHTDHAETRNKGLTCENGDFCGLFHFYHKTGYSILSNGIDQIEKYKNAGLFSTDGFKRLLVSMSVEMRKDWDALCAFDRSKDADPSKASSKIIKHLSNIRNKLSQHYSDGAYLAEAFEETYPNQDLDDGSKPYLSIRVSLYSRFFFIDRVIQNKMMIQQDKNIGKASMTQIVDVTTAIMEIAHFFIRTYIESRGVLIEVPERPDLIISKPS